MKRLADTLLARGLQPDFDQSTYDPDNIEGGISAEDDWWMRLQEMIAAADVMVFLVSPQSAGSKVCDEEVAYARALGKRIIPILARPTDFAKVPPRLAALNVKIDFSESGRGFDVATDELVNTLERNVHWHREGRKLDQRISEWEIRGRPDSLLMRSGAVVEAESWAAARPRSEEEPGELFFAYLSASRNRNLNDERRQKFLRRAFSIAVFAALGVTLAGAWLVIAGQRNLDRTESELLAGSSERAFANNDYDRAVRLAILAIRGGWASDGSAAGAAALDVAARSSMERVNLKHEGSLLGATLFADETNLLTWSMDGSARIWSAFDGKETVRMDHGNSVIEARLFADDTRLLTRSLDYSIRTWDISSGVELARMNHENNVYDEVFFADETRLLTWGEDKSARIWDVESGDELVRVNHKDFVTGATVFSGEEQLLTKGEDGIVSIWSVATGKELTRMSHDGQVNGTLLFAGDTRLLTWSWDGSARIWDIPSGNQLSRIDHNGSVWNAELLAGDTQVLTWGMDSAIRVSDTVNGDEIALMDHGVIVTDAQLFADDSRLLSIGDNGTIKIWNMISGEEICHMDQESSVRDAMLFAGDSLLLTWGGNVRIWDTLSGNLIARFDHGGYEIWNTKLFANNTRLLTWSSDGNARIWDVSSGKELTRAGHGRGIRGAVLLADNTQLLSWSDDQTARIWDVEGMISQQHDTFVPRVADVCAERLAARSVNIEDKADNKAIRKLSQIDKGDISLAPILRSRLGEDICDYHEPWWYPVSRMFGSLLPEYDHASLDDDD